eukprot:COSAG02_NODE_16156_length_1108_cov_1.888999_2_plen_22_part_01
MGPMILVSQWWAIMYLDGREDI